MIQSSPKSRSRESGPMNSQRPNADRERRNWADVGTRNRSENRNRRRQGPRKLDGQSDQAPEQQTAAPIAVPAVPAEASRATQSTRDPKQQQLWPQPQKETFPISFKKLELLLKESPDDLIMILDLNRGWKCLLEKPDHGADCDQLLVVVKAFHKCLRGAKKSLVVGFLRIYFGLFESYLLGIVVTLLSDRNEKLAQLVYEILEMLQTVCAITPQRKFVNLDLILTLLKPSVEILELKLARRERTLTELMNAIYGQANDAREVAAKAASGERNGSPPNNYREIDIYPSIEDVKHLNPDVRGNIIDGPYENGYHYLDTHFRLLREDFVRSFREGIQNYISLSAEQRKENVKDNCVRHYFNVFCRGRCAALTDSLFFFALQLARRDYQNVDWIYSKRFANGSVIALSCDNFRSMVFVSITQRSIVNCCKGILFVECFRAEDVHYLQTGKAYSVIESTALFQAYQHNLKVLQDVNPEQVPFDKYIVKLDKNVAAPQFISTKSMVNLRPIMSDRRNTNTEVLNKLNWPALKSTMLESAQFEAVQSAFSRELCLIQGPPGTGKTFVGLLIVETFLLNRITSKPILVVCYTNHALDQFLTGIRNFSSQIVRVGGRCKDERILQYNLAELRKTHQECLVTRGNLVFRTARNYRYRLSKLRKEINQRQEILNEASRKLMPNEVLAKMSQGIFHNEQQIREWLNIDAPGKKEYQQAARLEREITANNELNLCNKFDRTTDEFQSDGEEDTLVDESDADNDTSEIVSQFLALLDKEQPPGHGASIGHELTMSNRPLLSEADASALRASMRWRGPLALLLDQRWDLYRHWHHLYTNALDEQAEQSRAEYRDVKKASQEIDAQVDIEILRKAQVIGMTTTGAAKYRHLLEKLGTEVVVVEEAAELLEAHVIATLSATTKQLILIGDHQQLRPSTADYKLARDYQLDISLFERLVNLGMPFVRLRLQHRMRPEFLKLLVPHIYPSLSCGESVSKLPNIRGMASNLQLMNHTRLESEDDGNASKTNEFECDMVVGLIRYLVLQGYSHDRITVLAMYSGQQLLIKRCMRRRNYKVRVTSVDNYQGEANDIVVVSFVRSNEHGCVGFLRTMNRVCVALSRARQGLFCIGNFTMIARRLPAFREILRSVEDCVTDHFKLECRKHKSHTRIFEPADYAKVSKGGCQQPCALRLACGHVCVQKCHADGSERPEGAQPITPVIEVTSCGHRCREGCAESRNPHTANN